MSAESVAVSGPDGVNSTRRSRVWVLRIGKRRVELGRSGTLLVSRVFEQAVLGLATVALAWRLGVHGFVPVSSLLVFNSFAVIASDFGLGTDLMHRETGGLGILTVRRVRILNSIILVVLLVGGVASATPWRELLIGSGFIWMASGEAFIRKSALIKLDLSGRAARGEVVGSFVLCIAIAIALAYPDHAVAVVAAGLAGKHGAEALVNQGWSAAFMAGGGNTWSTAVWLTGLLNFAIANVDFLIVAMVISGDAFSIYSLGFRLAAVFVAQISYVVTRVALVDFGEARRTGSLSNAYRHRRRQMFAAGIGAGLATAVLSPLLLFALGPEWHGAIGVAVVLSVAVPWRMCGGLGLVVAIAAGEASWLARWEASRLVAAAVVLSVGGLLGFRYFVIAAALVAIFTTVGYDRAALRLAGDQQRSWIMFATPVALFLIAFAAALLPFGV